MSILGPVLLALMAALAFDVLASLRGRLPPAFVLDPERPLGSQATTLLRRCLAGLLIAWVLWLGAFSGLTATAEPALEDLARVPTPQLFFLHVQLGLVVLFWYGLGYGASAAGSRTGSLQRQTRMAAESVPRELAVGALTGLLIWAAVLAVLLLLGLLVAWLGGPEALPEEPPALVSWIVGLPIAVRVALSCSAGFFEELFFRGLLQYRAGVPLSTGLFILAHLAYGQPLMLVGVALLSLTFAALFYRRGSIWSAAAAHAVFDAVQLLIVIPAILQLAERSS